MRKLLFVMSILFLSACSGEKQDIQDMAKAQLSVGRVIHIQPLSHERSNYLTDNVDTFFEKKTQQNFQSMLIWMPTAITGHLVAGRIEESQASDTRCLFLIRAQNGQLIQVEQVNTFHVRVGEDVVLSTQNGVTQIQKRLNQAYHPK